jgi:lactate dehydrogenase-like 2-hydroxyacid dehydrogenase
MAYQILVQSDVDPYEAVLPLLSDSCDLHMWREEEPPADTDFATIEGLYVYSHMWLDGALMERMPGLRVISNFGVGCDHIDLEGARRLSRGRLDNVDPHVDQRKTKHHGQKTGDAHDPIVY